MKLAGVILPMPNIPFHANMTISEPLPSVLREPRRASLAERSLVAEAVRWFEHCRVLRDFESKHLLVNPRPEDLRAHRVVIADLIADGEIIAWQARQSEIDLSAVEFTVADIEAETRLLRDNFRMFHEPMPAAVAERVLEATLANSPFRQLGRFQAPMPRTLPCRSNRSWGDLQRRAAGAVRHR